MVHNAFTTQPPPAQSQTHTDTHCTKAVSAPFTTRSLHQGRHKRQLSSNNNAELTQTTKRASLHSHFRLRLRSHLSALQDLHRKQMESSRNEILFRWRMSAINLQPLSEQVLCFHRKLKGYDRLLKTVSHLCMGCRQAQLFLDVNVCEVTALLDDHHSAFNEPVADQVVVLHALAGLCVPARWVEWNKW